MRQATERPVHVRERLCVQAAAPRKPWWHELLSAEEPLAEALVPPPVGHWASGQSQADRLAPRPGG